MADDVVDAGGLDQLLLAQQEQQVLANWSTDDHSKSDVLQVPAARASIVAVYVVVIVFGVLGNGLVVAVAASRVPRPSPASRNSLQVGSSRDDIVTNCPSQSAGNIREQ